MKLQFPIFRPSGPLPARGPNSGLRRTHIMQRSAGKMFHQWAEVVGQRLEEMINEDKQSESQISAMVMDEVKQKELLMQDDEEDFLDEGITVLIHLPKFRSVNLKFPQLVLIRMEQVVLYHYD